MAIVGPAVHLVTILVIEAAIRQVTVFVTAVLPVVNISSALIGVVAPPVVPLIILNAVSLKRIVRNVEFLLVEVFEEFLFADVLKSWLKIILSYSSSVFAVALRIKS